MLKENIKTLRKQKGMSQQALAQQLHVVRQTVSKWEKGLSVPDAETLVRMAEAFDTPVSELLGTSIEQPENTDEIAAQLAQINEQLARSAKLRGKLITAVVIVAAAGALAAIYPRWNEIWYEFGRNWYHLLHG